MSGIKRRFYKKDPEAGKRVVCFSKKFPEAWTILSQFSQKVPEAGTNFGRFSHQVPEASSFFGQFYPPYTSFLYQNSQLNSLLTIKYN